MKLLYFDTETTGVDSKVNEIVQFAAIVEIDGKVVEEVNWQCQPTRWDKIDPMALKTIGKTVEDLKALPAPSEMMKNIRALFDRHIDKFNKADKFYPAGHNVQFDLEFLQAFWKQHGDTYGTGSYQNWRCLDSRILANFLLYKDMIPCADVKLETLCNHFKVAIQAHDAMSDIRATRELIQLMSAFLEIKGVIV